MLKTTFAILAVAALLAGGDRALAQAQNGLTDCTIGSRCTTAVESRKSQQYKKWHWYELSDAQHDKMVVALKAIKDRQQVNVLCGDADCRELAKDFVDAFDDAGWKASMISSGFVGNDPGLRCSHKPVCDAITRATGIRTVAFDEVPPGVITIMFGPKK